jgi:hypothetical protein
VFIVIPGEQACAIFAKPVGSMPAREDCKSMHSVADPGCLSRIPDTEFYPSRIQKQQQKRGMKKKFVVIPLNVATKFTKFKIILVLKC